MGDVGQTWSLPCGEVLHGPPPRRFGLLIRRQAEDAYAVSLVWDGTCRQWFSLHRHEVAGTALSIIVAALGAADRLPAGSAGRLGRATPDLGRLTPVRTSRRVEQYLPPRLPVRVKTIQRSSGVPLHSL